MRTTRTCPLVIATDTVASLLGIDRATLYRLARTNKAPIDSLVIGRSVRWRTADVAAFLGIGTEDLWRLLGTDQGKPAD